MHPRSLMLLFSVALTSAYTSNEDITCESVADRDTHPVVMQNVVWKDIADKCTENVRQQIRVEIDASNKYLQLGAYFSRETVNRPGFADLFFKACKEERQRASKLIGYLLMRGRLTDNRTENDDLAKIFTFPNSYNLNINEDKSYSGLSALKKAQEMETSVTNSIKVLIATCEKERGGPVQFGSQQKIKATVINDYHLVDYLISEFLNEQYDWQRQLAGHIVTLSKFMGKNKEIGEFLFDKSILL